MEKGNLGTSSVKNTQFLVFLWRKEKGYSSCYLYLMVPSCNLIIPYYSFHGPIYKLHENIYCDPTHYTESRINACLLLDRQRNWLHQAALIANTYESENTVQLCKEWTCTKILINKRRKRTCLHMHSLIAKLRQNWSTVKLYMPFGPAK